MSALITSDSSLCSIHYLSTEKNKHKSCMVQTDRATGVVLFLIGLLFLASGLYLYLGNTGTIAAFSIGCSLFIASALFLLGGSFVFFKSFYKLR